MSAPRFTAEQRAAVSDRAGSALLETYEDERTTSYMNLFKRLTSVDLLHLDDLGAERRTEWVLEQLYSIINERWPPIGILVVSGDTPREATALPQRSQFLNKPYAPDRVIRGLKTLALA